jgi:AraC-like DNA-binding protein
LRVIETMRERLGEPLTIDDMARTAMFSKFHFTRIFRRVTGLSPGRFLSAMRLQRAQELLVTTSLNVADISYQVGYNSVGTFSSRFARSVGLSPTEYRQHGGFAPEVRLDRVAHNGHPRGAVRGAVLAPPGTHLGWVFIGLFPDLIRQGRPVACVVLPSPGTYLLENVPTGTWHLVATSIASHHDLSARHTVPHHRHPTNRALYVGRQPAFTVPPDTVVGHSDLRLRPSRAIDPPLLLALPCGQRDGPTTPMDRHDRPRGPTLDPTGPLPRHGSRSGHATGVHVTRAPSSGAHHGSAATASAPAPPGNPES